VHEPEREEPTVPAYRAIALLVGAPALGATLGLLLLVTLVLPNMSLGDLQRIIELGRHLDEPAPADRVVFLGDSIVRDGIDAAIVRDAASPGWQVENLGLSGCGLNECRVLLPRLMQTRPSIVVTGLHVRSLCTLDRVGPDKGYAYAYAGFTRAWPDHFAFADFPGMTPPTFDALRSTRLAQWLHFRTAPANWFDHRMRVAARDDLRSGYEADWVHPFTRTGSIHGPRLERHLAKLARGLTRCADGDWEAAGAVAKRLNVEIQGQGATPILLLLPVHPRLSELATPLLPRLNSVANRVAAETRGAVVDASALLGEDAFADAVHPNESGRATLSTHVGRLLPAPDGR
jgi:hypothetical protein